MLSCQAHTHTDISYAIALFTSPSPQGPTRFIILSNSSQFSHSSNLLLLSSAAYTPTANSPTPPVPSVKCEEKLCQSRLKRPEALWGTHVPLPILSSDQRGNGSSLCEHMYTCAHTDTYLSIWKMEGGRPSLSSNRWLPCLRQWASLDSTLTTAAKAERDERQEGPI